MILEQGRPQDVAGRLERETRTYDLLDRLGITYDRVDHAPADTMEVCREIDQSLDLRRSKVQQLQKAFSLQIHIHILSACLMHMPHG